MDAKHFQYLLNALKQRDEGRTAWLAYKERNHWVDLSTADLTRRPLRGYNLSETDLSLAIFREANLQEADLSDAVLSCADLRRADLRNAILDRVRLDRANLQEANLADACLERANLGGARLTRATLVGADLSGADLTEADLSGACLKFACLTGARLDRANVSGADLTGAVLDDDVPRRVENFSQSRIDDRQYREMRSRAVGPEHPEPDDEISQGRILKVDTRRSTHRPSRAGGDGPRPRPAADTPPQDASPKRHWDKPAAEARREKQKSSRASVPPVRDVEPDLNTIEGCCEVLGITPNAAMDEVVRAFRSKAKVYHPDKVRHLSPRLQDLASEEFRRLRRAYEALTRRTARPLNGGINWPEGMPRYASPYDYTSEQYEIFARLNPANTNILYNMAWKYFEDGRYAEARAGFERVLAINPQDMDAQYNIIIVRLYSELLLPELGEE